MALGERLGKALGDEEMQRAGLLMGKMSNQLLKETGREPIPVNAMSPLGESVEQVFRKYRHQRLA